MKNTDTASTSSREAANQTERHATEHELYEAEQRFHHLVDAVTDYAIFMLDAGGHVATWNAGAARTKGYTPAEIIGKHFSVFYTAEDRAVGRPEKILDSVRREGRFAEEGWRVRKDGSRFWASVVITALRDSHGNVTGFAKVTRDLTERRQAEEIERQLLREQYARATAEESERKLRESEEAARDARTRAEQATRLKDEFLATVSHELRTPLNSLLGYAILLRDRRAGMDEGRLAKAIDAIYRNAQAQARIIDDILDVSRIVTGKLKLDVKATDLVAVAKEAMEVLRPAALAKQVALEVVSGDEVALLVGDPERLRQVVWNLISNAVKFTDSGGAVRVLIRADGSHVELAVEDTGKGIDPELLPHVFDRFRQADSSTTRTFGGLGLGLAIVRHIVELHGGRVTAASEGLGRGATLRVRLPVRPSLAMTLEPENRSTPWDTVTKPLRSLAGLKVLVVDDDPDSLDLLRITLDEAGAEVATAGSASAGLEAALRERPHVLVSDIGMPGVDGYSFIRALRARSAAEGGTVTSIALTAYTRAEDRTKALDAGFTAHVGKPVDPADLVAMIASLRPAQP